MRKFSRINSTPNTTVAIKRTFNNLKDLRAKETISKWSESAFQDKFFGLVLLCWFVPIVFSILYIAFNYSTLPSQIPLFYSRMWGEGQLAKTGYIYLPPLGALLLGIVNFALAISFHNRDKVMAYFLFATSALISVLAAITIFNIVNLIR